ncbi:hypothetical protein [Roseomonas sp. KE2513]|uniref:hypothetical protein n=1 Tax=Roseomonas sp. KE2513 TaxID=2479202 RepID=UPI0018DF2C03|nr:hypothetical protein [Roseomonas sp. KE2513]
MDREQAPEPGPGSAGNAAAPAAPSAAEVFLAAIAEHGMDKSTAAPTGGTRASRTPSW